MGRFGHVPLRTDLGFAGQDQEGMGRTGDAQDQIAHHLEPPPLQVQGLTAADLDRMLVERERQLHAQLWAEASRRISDAHMEGYAEGEASGAKKMAAARDRQEIEFAEGLEKTLRELSDRAERLYLRNNRPTHGYREAQATVDWYLKHARDQVIEFLQMVKGR